MSVINSEKLNEFMKHMKEREKMLSDEKDKEQSSSVLQGLFMTGMFAGFFDALYRMEEFLKEEGY
jgi:hypothetical protein